MSQILSGSASKCWGGKEATYGSGSYSAANLINMTSESLSTTYSKIEEGTLLATKTRPSQELGSVTVSGGVSTILKPDFVDFAFEWTMGTKKTIVASSPGDGETTDNYDEHYDSVEYTLAPASGASGNYLPSAALKLVRGNQNFLYNGLTVSSLSLDCTAGDFVKADINVTGQKELYSGSWSDCPSPTDTGSYRCLKAKLYYADADSDELSNFDTLNWNTCSTHTYDVTRTQLTIDNGIETVPQTYCSGVYANQPIYGQRNVSVSCEMPYSAEFETFRRAYYANENASNLSLMLTLCTKDTIDIGTVGSPNVVPKYQILVIIPNVNLDDASANVGGQGLINANFSGTALSVSDTEPIKVIVRTAKVSNS